MYLYLNGSYVRKEEAQISPFDYGFLYGLGVFETFRLYDGHPFLLDDHLDRLNRALEDLKIRKLITKQEIIACLAKLMQMNGWADASIRLNISAGIGKPGLQTIEYTDPTVFIYGGELQPAPSTMNSKEGTILTIRRNTPEGNERWKSHHFLNNILAKQELGGDPLTEGIFLTDDGHVAEGITSNIFWVKAGTVYTPSIDTGILNGITRQYVLSLCEKLQIPFCIGEFPKEALMDADECFVTNSVQEIVGLSRIGEHQFAGTKGKLTTTLFSQYVESRHKLWTRRI
ncbi:aminodeoxychorismate lyase [Pseudalkalibacillus decolorationis]|uniref:aminodeoxychorismate lyase n=1 Tax=Pseudalkalibacillus decolorationis TaxID=163879 RepID=UPI002148DCA0|nr:aminodeoxychorismate lyase [Pseudalkalibacillus decolorationis]